MITPQVPAGASRVAHFSGACLLACQSIRLFLQPVIVKLSNFSRIMMADGLQPFARFYKWQLRSLTAWRIWRIRSLSIAISPLETAWSLLTWPWRSVTLAWLGTSTRRTTTEKVARECYQYDGCPLNLCVMANLTPNQTCGEFFFNNSSKWHPPFDKSVWET